MKRLITLFNILAIIPAIILVPLAPFTFILIEGEGSISGYFHEYLLKTLMVSYTFILVFCIYLSIRLMRRGQTQLALVLSTLPTLTTTAIVLTYLFGGIHLR
ncbi:MAG: hypothetical protein GKR95_23150 [Gammaproteobacteria bacterium]|nr:hypothetical protein [Gammaproteobacteria bacterium]